MKLILTLFVVCSLQNHYVSAQGGAPNIATQFVKKCQTTGIPNDLTGDAKLMVDGDPSTCTDDSHIGQPYFWFHFDMGKEVEFVMFTLTHANLESANSGYTIATESVPIKCNLNTDKITNDMIGQECKGPVETSDDGLTKKHTCEGGLKGSVFVIRSEESSNKLQLCEAEAYEEPVTTAPSETSPTPPPPTQPTPPPPQPTQPTQPPPAKPDDGKCVRKEECGAMNAAKRRRRR